MPINIFNPQMIASSVKKPKTFAHSFFYEDIGQGQGRQISGADRKLVAEVKDYHTEINLIQNPNFQSTIKAWPWIMKGNPDHQNFLLETPIQLYRYINDATMATQLVHTFTNVPIRIMNMWDDAELLLNLEGDPDTSIVDRMHAEYPVGMPYATYNNYMMEQVCNAFFWYTFAPDMSQWNRSEELADTTIALYFMCIDKFSAYANSVAPDQFPVLEPAFVAAQTAIANTKASYQSVNIHNGTLSQRTAAQYSEYFVEMIEQLLNTAEYAYVTQEFMDRVNRDIRVIRNLLVFFLPQDIFVKA